MQGKKFKLSAGNYSDKGKVRETNQDYFGSEITSWGHLFIVADGMGGHRGGKTASRMTVNIICESFKLKPVLNPSLFLRSAILDANQKIMFKAAEDPNFKGMGTTIVAVLIKDSIAHYAHVGDSRIYLFRQGTWRQITKDHSLVQQMVDKGIITNDIAEVHPNKNLILQAVGSGNIQPDISSEKLENGDVLLLCSDGLSGKVGGEEMLRIVEKHSPTNACKELVNLANERGGNDNITVTVIRVDQ